MDTITSNTEYKYNPTYHRFADFFGVDKFKKDDPDVAKKLSVLYDWGAKKSGSDNYVDVIKELIKFQKSLGNTARGKTLVDDMYLWARIDIDKIKKREKRKLEKQKDIKNKEEISKRQQIAAQRKKDLEDAVKESENRKELEQKERENNFKEAIKQREKQSKLDKGAGLKAVRDVPLETPKPINLPV